MKQATFNNITTIYYILFFSAIYVWAFVTGKHVDIEAVLTFLVPTVNQIVHIYYRTRNGVENATQKGEVTEGH